jgi:DNA-binding MarR family transcriptional regulator
MLSRQVLSPQASPDAVQIAPWVRFLRAHASVTRELNARLIAEHGLTLNDYEVLLQLAHAPDRQLRRVDLATRVLLTASGITRLLDGLERAGYVERGQCASDARVSYAVLTDAGYEKLREAADTHLEDVQALFFERFSERELGTLAELLGRLGGAEDATACGVD